MKVLIVTNIFLQATQLATYLKKRDIDSTTLSLTSRSESEIANSIKSSNLVIIDLPTNYVKDMILKVKSIDVSKPIIVLGNNDQYKDIIEFSKLGIYKYIKKPFDSETIIKYIREIEAKKEIQERNAKRGFAIYTRVVSDIVVVNVLGYLQPEVIDELREIVTKYKKAVISLNGISSVNLDVDILKSFKSLLDIEGSDVRFILVREKIKSVLVEEGISESLIFPNEFLAVKSFS
ncbi:MAG: hypothetical protein ABDH28_01015 [Brevinematia bacterium]